MQRRKATAINTLHGSDSLTQYAMLEYALSGRGAVVLVDDPQVSDVQAALYAPLESLRAFMADIEMPEPLRNTICHAVETYDPDVSAIHLKLKAGKVSLITHRPLLKSAGNPQDVMTVQEIGVYRT